MGYRNRNHYLLNLSSLPNTLNNRISFQIPMQREPEFTVKQIVWAKVPDYPWWPARIASSLTQQSRSIYKVHFFGDPTYCYLQSQRIVDFETGLASLPEDDPANFILKRPIQLAKAAYKKTLQQPCLEQSHQESCLEAQNRVIDYFQQTKIQSNEIIENADRQSINEEIKEQKVPEAPEMPYQVDEITCENVLEIISSPYFKQLKATKGYNHKKQTFAIETKLTEVLLAKYSLHAIPETFSLVKSAQPSCVVAGLQKIKAPKPRLTKRQKLAGSENMCIRKLYKVLLRNVFQSRGEAHAYSEKIIEIIKSSFPERKKFYRKYVQVLKGLGQGTEEAQKYVFQMIQANQHEALAQSLEQFKKEDEQKSKLTQIGCEYL